MQELTLGLVVIILFEVTVLLLSHSNLTGQLRKHRPVFVDTSVLMDGRIIFAAQSGFIPPRLVIPRSVVAELQLLADGSDHDKRSRARHGLDVVKQLQDIDGLKVEVMDDGAAKTGVDDQLLRLAKKHHGAICTIDFNLNKVATVEHITVLNINELAQQLRIAHLPGEHVSVELIQKGSDAHQGVGYLADGTMVVVEQANRDIGSTVEVELTRSLQTAAGRMVFAKKLVAPKSPKSAKPTVKQAVKAGSSGRARTTKSKRPATPEDSLLDLVDRQ